MSRLQAIAGGVIVLGALMPLAGCGSQASAPTAVPATVGPPTPPVFPTFKAGAIGGPTRPPRPIATPTAQVTSRPVPETSGPTSHVPVVPALTRVAPGPTPTQGRAAPGLAALEDLSWRSRRRGGRVPGGCATLAGKSLCVPPVRVDGKLLPDITLLGQLINRPSGPAGLHEAIAAAVFQRLLYLEGRRSGIPVTRAQARVVAEGELAAYQKNPASRSLVPLPDGVSARQYFLSRQSIEAYRAGMIEGRERDAILRSHAGSRAGVFASWLRRILPRHAVAVADRPPSFSLPAAIRAAYSCAGQGGVQAC